MFDIFLLQFPLYTWFEVDHPQKNVKIEHIWNMVNKTWNRFTINMVIFADTHVIHTMVDHSELQYHVYTIQFTGMVTGKYKVATYKGKYIVSVNRQLY